jgi:serine/threonine protein phosphatase PrpC
LVAVCDGLGHGPLAREAAAAAIEVFRRLRSATPRAIIEECHRTLGPTRGAVMAVVSATETTAPNLELASVGNITIELARTRSSRRFGASSCVLGSSQPGWRARFESTPIEPNETLILYSDGITSRASLGDDVTLLLEHPIVIAHQLVERFSRDNDDVLVLVAK